MASGLPACTLLKVEGASMSANRTVVPVAAEKQGSRAELGALVALERGGKQAAEQQHGLARLHGAEALEVILRNLHRPRVPTLLGKLPEPLPWLASPAAGVRVYRWNVRDTALDGNHLEELEGITD